MADVIIDFIVNTQQLDSAIATLEKTGQIDAKVAEGFKQTNAAISQQSAALKKTAQDMRGPITSLDQLDKRTKKFVSEFIKGFEEGVKNELLLAKKEIDGLRAKFDETGKTGAKATNSLKQELKSLTQQIAQAKATGGPIDPAMIKRAGELKDAIADANAEIANAGSDTRGLDNLIGTVSAVAGGFAVLQGSAALFGDESEETQKALVRLNATMAVLQGLQQVQNALQKEGAITKVADASATALQVVQQRIYTLVTGQATAATTAFKIALASTGIGLIVVALGALVVALATYTRNSREAAEATGELRGAVKNLGEELDKSTESISRNTQREIIDLKKAGAEESQLIQARIDGLQNQTDAIQAAYDRDKAILDKGLGDAEERQKLDEALTKRKAQLVNNRIELQELELDKQKALEDEQNQLAEDRKKREQEALEAQRTRIQDSIARLKTEQLLVDEGTITYNRLQAAIVTLEGQYNALGKTAAQAALATASAAKEAERLTRDQSSTVDATLNKLEKGTIDTSKALLGVSASAAVVIQDQLQTTEESLQEFLARVIPQVQTGLQALSTIGSGLNAIAQEQMNNQQILIDQEKEKVAGLLEAGAITEKEAEQRNARLERQEKQAQARAAQRQKQLAIFQAVVNTAQAVVQALGSAPPPANFALAAVVGALGAAQIAAIASRPVPKFFKGKKDNYEGMGIVGESGSELVTQGGRMFVASKPTMVYLGKKDKVYTPAETRAMLPKVVKSDMKRVPEKVNGFDYAKMASLMPKPESTVVNIDRDFIRESVADGLRNSNYYNRRYSSK